MPESKRLVCSILDGMWITLFAMQRLSITESMYNRVFTATPSDLFFWKLKQQGQESEGSSFSQNSPLLKANELKPMSSQSHNETAFL